MSLELHVAPVQGHTDAAWRHFHNKVYDGNLTYYTPFIRLEHGEIRKHDLKDYTSPLNKELILIPQVIFRNTEELRPLIEILVENNAKQIDLNCGCPFPLQTAKGRGAGFIGNRKEFEKIPSILEEYPEIDFSLKMRLGMIADNEWEAIIDIINNLKLTHVTLHPRFAKEQYGGEVHLDQFEKFLAESRNPVIYNGDLRTPQDIRNLTDRFPAIKGVMTARGLLGRPSLLKEYESGCDMDKETRLSLMKHFHRELLMHYESVLCGDAQILSKIKPFWEYAEEEIGRKAWKAIRKSVNIAKYNSALALINS